jgi:nucleotide-binding universal stress UspA family protein
MFQNLVVPVDLSKTSIDAVAVAARMAARVGGRVDAITVIEHLSDLPMARADLAEGIDRLGPQPVEVRQLIHTSRSVIGAITRHVEREEGSMIVMSSHGHGRSAAVLGSTVDELLRATFGPLIVVGPHAAEFSGDLGGTYVVPLDGSPRADGVIPIVGAWATEFGGTPWLVEVIDEAFIPTGAEIVESSYVSARAGDLQRRIGREVSFEVLHGRHPGHPIVDFARSQSASLIFMATHGRTGLERLTAGSVAADVVRHAEVPVVLFRPPEVKRLQGNPGVIAATVVATT